MNTNEKLTNGYKSNRAGILPDKRTVKYRLSYGRFWLTVIGVFTAGVVVGGFLL